MANPLFDKLFAPHVGSTATFLVLPDGARVSYGDFLDQTAQFANVIKSFGLEEGDRLAVQIEKSPEALAVYAACAMTGIVFLPLNTAYAPAEVSYFLSDSGARLFLCDPQNLASLETIAQNADATILTLGSKGDGSFFDVAKTKAKISIIEDWVFISDVPCVAIGGINPSNCHELVEAGADFIAVVGSIWNNSDSPINAIKNFKSIIV